MPAKRTLLRLALGLAALTSVGALAAPSASAATPCPNAGTLAGVTSLATYNDAVLCLLNEQRADAGLLPVTVDAGLTASALGHSDSMQANSYFQHDSPDGTTFADRIAQTGFLRGARRWLIGENIAWGSLTLGTPQALMTAWMNSPEHRDNILEPAYREIGVGTAWGAPSNPLMPAAAIVTTDFGYVQLNAKPSPKKAKKARKAKKKRRAIRKRLRGH
ncbi:MAG: hypothetical protein QOD60_2495 [Solirubrobacterales bacterium]|jgi:uncharacterized protein YkwD|nr:hypothetical protein [Solirubrobacterales bacterium]